jgi:hypothetical protein
MILSSGVMVVFPCTSLCRIGCCKSIFCVVPPIDHLNTRPSVADVILNGEATGRCLGSKLDTSTDLATKGTVFSAGSSRQSSWTEAKVVFGSADVAPLYEMMAF